jgi:hypothetical protein
MGGGQVLGRQSQQLVHDEGRCQGPVQIELYAGATPYLEVHRG